MDNPNDQSKPAEEGEKPFDLEEPSHGGFGDVVLESSPSEVATSLFAEDPLAMATAKAAVLESFLKLLTRDLKFQDFTREILLIVMNTVKTEAGSLFEVDHANNQLFFRSVVGQSSDTITKFSIPMGQGIVGHVAESRQPLIVANVAENKLHLKAIQDAVGFETRNIIAIPMLIRGRVYGVLELLNRIGEDEFTNSDLELLNYLCDMASKTIEVRLVMGWASTRKASGEAA